MKEHGDGASSECNQFYIRRVSTSYMNWRFIVLFPALLCAGCFGSRDASVREPFRAYVHRTVELRCPMVLTEHGGYLFSSNTVLSIRHVRYGLAEPGRYPGRRVFAALPPGHRLTIDAIRDEMAGDDYRIVIYGRTRFPTTGAEVSFAYDHLAAPLPPPARSHGLIIPPAHLEAPPLPWEPE
jgi:hypothetical protein